MARRAATPLYSQYQHAFPVAYREDFSPRHAVLDISLIEEALAGAPLALKLYKPLRLFGQRRANLKVFRAGQPVSLSPACRCWRIWACAQDERPYAVERADGATVWINDFGLEVANVAHIEKTMCASAFSSCCAAWRPASARKRRL